MENKNPEAAAPAQPVPPRNKRIQELCAKLQRESNDDYQCPHKPSCKELEDAAPSPVLTQPSAERPLFGNKIREAISQLSSVGRVPASYTGEEGSNPSVGSYSPDPERPVLPVQPEIKRLQAVIERERTKYAEVTTKIKHAVEQRDWLTEGRGPYEWNDDNWHKEFAAAGKEILEALIPLEKIAGDLSDSPKTQSEVDAARASSPAVAPAERCPSCGSREKAYRLCMIENCGEPHFEETVFSSTHMKAVCSDSWHTAAPAVAGRTQGDLSKLAEECADAVRNESNPDFFGVTILEYLEWAALRESAREAPSKDMFWPPANAIEEHLYEIRNGKVKEYVMEHVQALQSETLEALRNMTEIAQGLLRGECYDRAGPKFLAHFHNAQRILGLSASPEAPAAPATCCPNDEIAKRDDLLSEWCDSWNDLTLRDKRDSIQEALFDKTNAIWPTIWPPIEEYARGRSQEVFRPNGAISETARGRPDKSQRIRRVNSGRD